MSRRATVASDLNQPDAAVSAATFFVQQSVIRGNTATFLARIKGADQQFVTQADWYSSTWELWKKNRGAIKRLTDPEAFDPADAVFDTLQTDYGWDLERDPEGLGYNFRLTVSGVDTDDGPILVLVLRVEDQDNLPGILAIEFQTVPVVQ